MKDFYSKAEATLVKQFLQDAARLAKAYEEETNPKQKGKLNDAMVFMQGYACAVQQGK